MAIVDYYSGTFPEQEYDYAVRQVLRWTPSLVEGKGAHGYKRCQAAEGFRVYSDGGAGMGVYVQVSGVGCARIMELYGVESFAGVGREWLGRGFRATRVDLAFDSHSEEVTAAEAWRAFHAGEVRTHWRRSRDVSEYAEGLPVSVVWYAGKIDSDVSLCCYDKRLETMSKGNADPGHWTRFELRFRGERAGMLSKWIVEHGGLHGAEGFLSSAVDFVVPQQGVERFRWKRAEWWEGFLQSAAKIRMARVKVAKPFLERAANWRRIHGPTLAMLALVTCGGVLYGPWVQDTIVDGVYRLSQLQQETVRQELGFTPGLLGMAGNDRRVSS